MRGLARPRASAASRAGPACDWSAAISRSGAHAPRAFSRVLPALLAGVVFAALALAALRVDLIRVRYGLGQAMQ